MRFGGLGGLEWVIILIIVVLLFGPGRIGRIAGEVGRSIRAFREGISGHKDEAGAESEPAEKKDK